jgi:hypothetical protein
MVYKAISHVTLPRMRELSPPSTFSLFFLSLPHCIIGHPWNSFVSLQFLNPRTVGRIPWTSDQPVARPLPTQTQNKRRHSWLDWAGEDCSCLRPRGHYDWHSYISWLKLTEVTFRIALFHLITSDPTKLTININCIYSLIKTCQPLNLSQFDGDQLRSKPVVK